MDSEISAMSKIAEALESLDPETKNRVLRWAVDRYSVKLELKGKETSKGKNDGKDDNGEDNKFESFAELFAAFKPQSPSDEVLIAAFWHQEILGKKELNSAELNTDLKNLGHGQININEKFDSLINQKPQLALQLRKSGSTKQARKKYKLTQAAIDKVKETIK